jgi:diguanylate cyclase (GGDEF)-like protein
MDELTGAYRRGPGMVELEREMSRAKRTKHPFVIGFIDVDGLKARNDSLGHAAGDELLIRVVDALRGQLRSYDLIARFGGDEFVCGIQDLNMAETAKRFAIVDNDLRTHDASITVGLAELGEDDSLSQLIARADEELYAKRSLRPTTRT